MRNVLLIALLLALSSVAVLAQVTCDDSDKGPTERSRPDPYISVVGKVKYGLTDKTDECVSGPEGFHKDPSLWVREYFCADMPAGEGGVKSVQRVHEDYDCVRYGYTKCEGGKCVGKSNDTIVKHKSTTPEPTCGNEKIDAGEECDPPDDICYLQDNIGVCTRKTDTLGECKCKLYKPGGTAAPEQPPAEQPPAEQPPAEQPPAEQPPAEQPPVEQPPAEISPAATPDEPAGVSVTRAITNSVKRFFVWIGSWFS